MASIDKNEMMIGVGELYIDDVRLGNLKNATFTYTKTFAEGKPGDMTIKVRRDMLTEDATLTGTLCDFNIERLFPILGITQTTSGLTNTSTLKIAEDKTMPGTVSSALTITNVAPTTASVQLYSADYKTKYARSTAYTITLSGGAQMNIWAKTASATLKNAGVIVEYDYADVSALTVKVGGKTTHEEKKLKFVHKLANGKHVQIVIAKAQMTGEFSIPWSEDAYSEIPISFTAIGDASAAVGTRLFQIIKER